MKALLAIAPKLPQASDLKTFSACLTFLQSDFKITWIDPLEQYKNLSYEQYTEFWLQKIAHWLEIYDVFMGFSLGGILLQNALNLVKSDEKTIILFSPPSKLDENLREKLTRVYDIAHEGDTEKALKILHQYVHEGAGDDFTIIPKEPWPDITSRLLYGLGYVLNHEMPMSIKECKTVYYQLVGEDSQLVTKANILSTPNSVVQVVPNAGNRILEDNPIFSQAIIKEWLYGQK